MPFAGCSDGIDRYLLQSGETVRWQAHCHHPAVAVAAAARHPLPTAEATGGGAADVPRGKRVVVGVTTYRRGLEGEQCGLVAGAPSDEC